MLYRDDGRPLGMIMRYCEDAPTYAWVRVNAARDAGARQCSRRRGRPLRL
jgi:hypothetical protein